VRRCRALGSCLPDVDRPNEGVLRGKESRGDSRRTGLALRYDLTAPLPGFLCPTPSNDLRTPIAASEWTGLAQRKSRVRAGSAVLSVAMPILSGHLPLQRNAEICAMLADCLEKVGIERANYIVPREATAGLNV